MHALEQFLHLHLSHTNIPFQSQLASVGQQNIGLIIDQLGRNKDTFPE